MPQTKLANLATFFKLNQSSEKVASILFYIQECKFVSNELKRMSQGFIHPELDLTGLTLTMYFTHDTLNYLTV